MPEPSNLPVAFAVGRMDIEVEAHGERFRFDCRAMDSPEKIVFGAAIANEPFVTVDTETPFIVFDGHPIVPVILQVCYLEARRVDIVPWQMIPLYLERLARARPHGEMVAHNWAFDSKVLSFTQDAWLWGLFWDGCFTDTMLRFSAKWTEQGEHQHDLTLKAACRKTLGVDLSKDETVRCGYYRGMAIGDAEFRYAATDPIATALLRKFLGGPDSETHRANEQLSLKGTIALESVRDNGMLVDKEEYQRMRRLLAKNVAYYEAFLREWGVVPGQAGNKKELQNLLKHFERKLGIKLPRTPKSGDLQMTDLVRTQLPKEKQHPFFEHYCKFIGARQILSHFFHDDLDECGITEAEEDKTDGSKGMELLLDEEDDDEEKIVPAKIHPDMRIHPRIKSETKTGRTNASGPNSQNFPRDCQLYWFEGGKVRKEEISVRGYIIPSPGFCLNSTDFNQLELCGLGEHCKRFFKESVMADLINDGVDLHTWFAEIIARTEGYDWKMLTKKEKKKYRNYAKVCNFGEEIKVTNNCCMLSIVAVCLSASTHERRQGHGLQTRDQGGMQDMRTRVHGRNIKAGFLLHIMQDKEPATI